MYLKRSLIIVLFVLSSIEVSAQQIHIINAEARIFNPDVLYIQPGEYVKFVNMTSHDAVSINQVPLPDGQVFDGMLPEGAEGWKSKMGNDYYPATGHRRCVSLCVHSPYRVRNGGCHRSR